MSHENVSSCFYTTEILRHWTTRLFTIVHSRGACLAIDRGSESMVHQANFSWVFVFQLFSDGTRQNLTTYFNCRYITWLAGCLPSFALFRSRGNTKEALRVTTREGIPRKPCTFPLWREYQGSLCRSCQARWTDKECVVDGVLAHSYLERLRIV